MASIADSSAIQNPEGLLPQHQAALTLLQSRLSNPSSPNLRWLDLACGRGQIILGLQNNLSVEARAKIEFYAYDINEKYARETRRVAGEQGFADHVIKVGDLSDFNKIINSGISFDFITLTNTVHEVSPKKLATILTDCIFRLNEFGTLFLYDMERIKPPELGAVPWNRDEIRNIVNVLLVSLGVSSYKPEVGRWNHRSCNAWNVQLERQFFGIPDEEANNHRETAIETTTSTIVDLIERKRELCKKSLETLTLCGAETGEEKDEKERLVFEFWALSRVLEGIR